MKKLFTFALLAAVALAGCGRGDTQDAYFGTWKRGDGFGFQATITAGKLVFLDLKGDGYTLENLTWEPVTSDGLSGYKLSGKLTAITDWYLDNYPLWKADGSGYAALNDTAANWWYTGADGNTLCDGNWSDGHEPGTDLPYTKQ